MDQVISWIAHEIVALVLRGKCVGAIDNLATRRCKRAIGLRLFSAVELDPFRILPACLAPRVGLADRK